MTKTAYLVGMRTSPAAGSGLQVAGHYRIDGMTVLPCPRQTRGVTCRESGLCRDDGRLRKAGLVIAFQAHGSGGSAVRKTLLSLATV
jgi:hypothetical protein